jgi:membrane-associated protease RseP (regulator of RpoE activity)
MKKHLAPAAALLMMLGQSAYAASSQPQLGSGVRVEEVDPTGAAAQAGIRPGDVIRAIGKMPINGYTDIDPALTAGKAPLSIEVDRDGKILRMKVTPQVDTTGTRKTLGIAQLGEAPKPRWALINWMMERDAHPAQEEGPHDLWHIFVEPARNSNPESEPQSPTQVSTTQQEGPHDLWHIFMGQDK